MVTFLASSPVKELCPEFPEPALQEQNGFLELLREEWPEEPGESEDPDYELFFEGLGLAETNVLPHYQKVKDSFLDGKLLVQEIAAGDSFGKRFFAIPDGSYILVKDGEEIVFGEAYLVADGEISEFCGEEECRLCWPDI